MNSKRVFFRWKKLTFQDGGEEVTVLKKNKLYNTGSPVICLSDLRIWLPHGKLCGILHIYNQNVLTNFKFKNMQ